MYITEIFIALIKNALTGAQLPKLASDIDWEAIYQLSLEQNVVSIVKSSIDRNHIILPDKLEKQWSEKITCEIAFDVTQEYELQWLLEACQLNQIKIMPLKGCILKSLYETPEYRAMGDIDFLFDPADARKLRKILEERGYSCTDFNTYHHDKYEMPPYLTLEPHRTLVSPENKNCYHYFQKGFALGHPDEANPFHYIMDEIPYFLFFLAHFHNHFSKKGAGIRFVMDYYVLKQKWAKQLEFSMLKPYLVQLELLDFYQQIDALADYWFGSRSAFVPQDLQAYILGSGVFGSSQQDFDNEIAKHGRIFYFLTLLIPPLYIMKWRYPVLNHVPFLLPFFWIYRIVTFPFVHRDTFKRRMRQFFKKK